MASWRLRNPMPRLARPVTGVDQVPQGAAQAVELPDDQGVAGAELIKELLEGWAVGAGTAGGLGEHPVAAAELQGVDLERWVLFDGGDAGIAEQIPMPEPSQNRSDGCVGGGGGGCGPEGCPQQNRTRSGDGGDMVSRCG
jgi:hypothetical protein